MVHYPFMNAHSWEWLLDSFLDDSISSMSEEEHWDMPIEPQDKGVSLDDADLRVGEDQQHNAIMGSQNHNTVEFDFDINHTVSQKTVS